MPSSSLFKRKHFLIFFSLVVFSLFVVKCGNPKVALPRLVSQVDSLVKRETAKPLDSITRHSLYVDSLLLRPRPALVLIDANGKPIKNRVTSVRSFSECFPDLNDVQLATAQRIGIPSIQDREEAARRKDELVYIGDNPFYYVEDLTHSVPYLVPRAATLLTEISRAFVDSLASKGLPFHRVVVSSVLRTRKDIERLRTHNVNASENSCHQYGTTFDINYNKYERVCDPDGPAQPEEWGVTLKSVLAEVLEDQRQLGTCYIRYEVKQPCFHITAR